MNPKEYKQMMDYLTRKGIKKPFTPASAIQRPKKVLEIEAFQDFNKRNPKAGGGMLVQPGFGGVRQGYSGKKASQKMTINEALTEIFETKKNFLNRDELKKLIDQKTGTDVSLNVLKPARYPILKKATYRTSELMKQKAKENISKGKLTKKERKTLALDKKEKRIKLFKDNLNVDVEIGPNNEVLGLDDDFKKKINNAQVTFRKKKLNTKGLETLNDPKFFEFFKNEYQTSDDRIKAVAERYGYTLDEWRELPENTKNRLYMEEFNNKIRIKRGEVPGGLSVDEIVNQAYEGKTIPGKGPASKTLDTVYETFFRQEYDKLAEKGDPFSKADLSRNVIARIKERFGRPGQDVPLSLFPANTDQLTDKSAKSYYQYIDPKTQRGSKKNKIFSDYELELFDGNTAASLNKTKTQEKIFNILTKGPVEMDQLTKELEITPNRVKSEINRLLTNAIVRQQKPAFLKGKEDLISNLVNNLEATKTLDGEWNRSLKYLIYKETPDLKIRENIFNKIDQFDALLKQVQDQFPGVQVNYDHPAAYIALKNQNFNEFLNITPIARDINNLKSRFDVQSNKNLLAMNDARASGNNAEFERLLNRQTKLENTWSQLTGGKSSLGKIRLEGVQDFGTLRLDDPKKNLLGEFIENISIRENIAKNLSDDIKTDLTDLLERKDKPTQIISTLEKVTSPDLIKQDRDVKNILLKLAAQLDPDCRKASASGGRIGFKSGTEVCLTKAKNYLGQVVDRGIQNEPPARVSLIKRIISGTGNFIKQGLSPKEFFKLENLIGRSAMILTGVVESGAILDDVLRKKVPLNVAAANNFLFGNLLNLDADAEDAKNIINDPNLSPAAKTYAQGIIDQDNFRRLSQTYATNLVNNPLFIPSGAKAKADIVLANLKNKISKTIDPKIEGSGRMDYERLLADKDDYDTAGEYVGKPQKVGLGTYVARDSKGKLRKVNKFGYAGRGSGFDAPDKPGLPSFTSGQLEKRNVPGEFVIDPSFPLPLQKETLVPSYVSPSYQNFQPILPLKEDVDKILRDRGRIGQDQELTEDSFQTEFSQPLAFEQLMELPSFRGARFARGGLSGGDTSGPPPERGPNPQGLPSLLKRVRNL